MAGRDMANGGEHLHLRRLFRHERHPVRTRRLFSGMERITGIWGHLMRRSGALCGEYFLFGEVGGCEEGRGNGYVGL